MKGLIVVTATLLIWLISIFMLCVIVSFVRYAKQELVHSFRNAKRFVKEMFIDIEWACKHNKKGNVNYEYDYE